jgi:hypothetical protein
MLVARLPDDDCQQIDTSALPVKHTGNLVATSTSPPA